MRYFLIILFSISLSACTSTTAPSVRPHCRNAAFDKKVSKSLNYTVPLISVDDLNRIKNKAYILDARKREEYIISHIPDAQYFEYDQWAKKQIPKDSLIVVYCSIGVRSEKAGEKLQKLGFTNVHNLFGSIFEWTNAGFAVVDTNNIVVERIHTYSWWTSSWVSNDTLEKVW